MMPLLSFLAGDRFRFRFRLLLCCIVAGWLAAVQSHGDDEAKAARNTERRGLLPFGETSVRTEAGRVGCRFSDDATTKRKQRRKGGTRQAAMRIADPDSRSNGEGVLVSPAMFSYCAAASRPIAGKEDGRRNLSSSVYSTSIFLRV